MQFTLIFTLIPTALTSSYQASDEPGWDTFFCLFVCERVCLQCSHSDDSDQRPCLSVGVWFLRLAGSTQPCQFSFSGCLLLVCHWTCCVMLIKDLKGQEAFREWSATGSGRNSDAKHWGEYPHSSPYLERNMNISECVNCRRACMMGKQLAYNHTFWNNTKLDIKCHESAVCRKTGTVNFCVWHILSINDAWYVYAVSQNMEIMW